MGQAGAVSNRSPRPSRFPNIEAIAAGCISGDFREWPAVRPEARDLLARLAAVEADVDRLSRDRGMLVAVHGALVDAGCTMGEIGHCEADLARQLTRERDEGRAELASLRAEITHDSATCHVCRGFS